MRNAPPSCRKRLPNLASQSRTAFASIVSNTGASSPGDLEITPSTSEVAVCCSSALLSSAVRACTSSNSRTFSIAITAWSAKVLSSSSWAFGIGPGSLHATTMAPIGLPARSIGTPNIRRPSCLLSVATRWS